MKIQVNTIQDEQMYDTMYLVNDTFRVAINFVFGDDFVKITIENDKFSHFYMVDTYNYEDVKEMAVVLDYHLKAGYDRLLTLLVDIIVGEFSYLTEKKVKENEND